MTENEIGTIVVREAIQLHRDLGPGLLESVYEAVLMHRLVKQGLSVERQVPIRLIVDEHVFDEGFRADLVIESKVIQELKSVEKLGRVASKQVLTYIRLAGMKLGYVLNFGEPIMKDGIIRLVHGNLDS